MNVVKTCLWSVADQLCHYKWPHFFERQILSFQSGMLTVRQQRRASPATTVFSLQKPLLAEQVEVNAEWFHVDKA